MASISFGPRFPASAASDGGNIDLTGDHSREPDYDYVQRGTVESLRARIAALEAERDAIKGERDFARVWSVRWKAVATRLWGGVHRALDAAEQLAARMQAAEAERDAARDWSARWKALALQYRTTARQNGESWQRLAEDFGAVSDENARLRAALEQAHTELFTVSLHSNPMLAYGHSQQAMQIIGAALAASAGEA